jgi:peptidoglycan/LPS O-acetylase OafA/YrhL
MNSQNRRMRVILSVIGLLCVAISIALNFAAPGTFWNWALLLVALGFLLLSRRYQ